MDKEPPPQSGHTSSNKISADSNYGSLITESSSSCLSLLSESDLFDDPSTSGCSSEMASMMQNREKKRQKVKEFLRELKSMVPNQSRGSKVGTLGTLDYVVSSMRKITDEQKQEAGQIFKAPSSEPVALPNLQCPDSVDFRNVNDGIIVNTQSELTAAVSLKNHVVLHTSTAFMDLLGYPHVWWKGRLLKDFVHKKDIMTVNSYINCDTSDTDSCASEPRSQSRKIESSKEHKTIFYARIRRFRSLSTGYSMSVSKSYLYFKVMVTSKCTDSIPDLTGEDQKVARRCRMLYFAPMKSPYRDGELPPEAEQRMFSLRHSLYCTYTYTHANTVALLGFLPQDIIGASIFDYYHPDDLLQLLEIYKKAMHSMGQPFKSGLLRLRTRNGCYVKVTTEWSSFMNPWDHRLEFIIAQHTIIKPPDNPNIFEDVPDYEKKSFDTKTEASLKIIEKIKDILQKPMTLDTMPLTPSDSGGAAGSPQNAGCSTPTREGDKSIKEKIKNETSQGPNSPSDISSSTIDEKSITSLYNQVNYSLNIKRFLLSHPKAFPVSDEDSSTDLVQKDDSEEDMNEEEEMQVEIPVVRPPSCGSSTQVHVSEQGFHEEVPSPPSFGGEDPGLTREAMDNQRVLTEDSLRKHTRAQELLYLQEASKEQPHLFHLRSRRRVGQRARQKRSRPSGYEKTTDVFKFARNAKSQRDVGGAGGGAGLYMSSFPITAVDMKPTSSQPANTGMMSPGPNVVGVMSAPYQPGMGVVPQLTMLPIDPATGVPHLQPYLPAPNSGIQWPYYPQSGYSLLPQVMAGFYQPLLQPVPMTSVTQSSAFTADPSPHNADATNSSRPTGMQSQQPHGMRAHAAALMTRYQHQCMQVAGNGGQCCQCDKCPYHSRPGSEVKASLTLSVRQPFPIRKAQNKEQQKSGIESDNHLSSADDTSSSIQYLLDAVSANNSSPNEETDEKLRRSRVGTSHQGAEKLPRRRAAVPPWLQTVNWTPEVRLKYKMPVLKVKNVLKKDREALKQMTQSESIKSNLEVLLEEIENPKNFPTLDEEADYIFYPELRLGEGIYTESEGEGEKTPRDTMSPTVAFEMGPAVQDQHTEADTAVIQIEKESEPGRCEAKKSKRSVNGGGGPEEPPMMDVVVTEDPLGPMLHLVAESMTMAETLDKVHSPASEGSGSSMKEGSAEGEGLADVEGSAEGEGSAEVSSPQPCPLDGAKVRDTAAMDSKCISSDDGRSDVGSDKGSENSSNNSRQKNEDAQSSSSKVSSNLTPSEERSTEDAGSSIKESDMATPKGSFASSNDKMSTDSGAESNSTPRPDIMEKLFVPLRVRMVNRGVGDKVSTLPFWQQEAEMTEQVALHYNIRPLDLSTILANDRRRLSDMAQPHQVNCQLLELLQEMEHQGHHKGTSGSMAIGPGVAACTNNNASSLGGLGAEGAASQTDSSSSDSRCMEPCLARLMRPPSARRSRTSPALTLAAAVKAKAAFMLGQGPADAATTASSSSSAMQDFGVDLAKGRGAVTVHKQLLDKLHSLTTGQHSEDWPGDVIMNKVFLPVDLVGTPSVAETPGRPQDSEILDAVD